MKHGGNVWEGRKPGDWLDFSANLRAGGPPDWITEALLEGAASARFYPDPSMKEAIKGLSAYAGVPEDHILPTPGGAAAIDLVLGTSKGRRVLLPSPTFGEYRDRARAHGRAVLPDTGCYREDDTVVRCNPNNPTGAVLSGDSLLLLHETVACAGGELLVDEAFIDYCPENSVREDVQDGLTVTGSLTKILGVPGVRLGYVVAAPRKIRELKKLLPPWNLSSSAVSLCRALPTHLDDIRREEAENTLRRERFAAGLRSLDVTVFPSAANFLLCRFPYDTVLLEKECRRNGILVRNCSSFGLDGRYLRLNVKTDEENAVFLNLLAASLKAGIIG